MFKVIKRYVAAHETRAKAEMRKAKALEKLTKERKPSHPLFRQ
jgi:hypothetical protein